VLLLKRGRLFKEKSQFEEITKLIEEDQDIAILVLAISFSREQLSTIPSFLYL